MLTLNKINKEVTKLFPGYEVLKGEDYFYVWGPGTECWSSTMIYTAKINHLTLAQWIEEVTALMKANAE